MPPSLFGRWARMLEGASEMGDLFVHRFQFAFTVVYHYLFPQLTMGRSCRSMRDSPVHRPRRANTVMVNQTPRSWRSASRAHVRCGSRPPRRAEARLTCGAC